MVKNIAFLSSLLLVLSVAGCTEATKKKVEDPVEDAQTSDSALSEVTQDASPSDTQGLDASEPVDASASDVTADVAAPDTSVVDASPTDTAVEDASPIDTAVEDGGMNNPCFKEVLCNEVPPECAAPLVPVPYQDCWGCGYPKTCSCDDGMDEICDMVPPECPPELTLAAQNGCYACVDPNTCAPPEPPKDTCAADEECVITAFGTLVATVEDCFCPMCPQWSVSKAEHQARQAAWNQVCAEWAKDNPCPAPKCAPPGEPICVQGQCELKPSSCEEGVTCFGLPLDCEAPFVSVAKDGCWACGYPETCSCSIAETPTCKKMTPNCPPGSEVAVQGDDPNFSCWACVDPYTCQEVKDPGPECNEKGECTLTTYEPGTPVNGEDDCYCPMCPNWAVTNEKAAQLKNDWTKHCKAWAEKKPCLPPACQPPLGDAQCVDGMCMMPDGNGPAPPPAP